MPHGSARDSTQIEQTAGRVVEKPLASAILFDIDALDQRNRHTRSDEHNRPGSWMKGGRLERPPSTPQGTAIAADQETWPKPLVSGPQLSGGFLGAGRILIGWGAENMLLLVEQIPGQSSNHSRAAVRIYSPQVLEWQ